jgi:hypothetical protein
MTIPLHPHRYRSQAGVGTDPDSRRRMIGTERQRGMRRKHAPGKEDTASTRELREIITLARIWIPYGGVPAELVFQTFGVSKRKFIGTLWRAVETVRCDPPLIRELAAIYPPPLPQSTSSMTLLQAEA